MISDVVHAAALRKKDTEIALLRERIFQLEDEIFALKDTVKLHTQSSRIRLPSGLHLTGLELSFLMLFATRAKGTILSKEVLHRQCCNDNTALKLVDVIICKIRAKLKKFLGPEHDSLVTIWGSGYVLSDYHFSTIVSWFNPPTVDVPKLDPLKEFEDSDVFG